MPFDRQLDPLLDFMWRYFEIHSLQIDPVRSVIDPLVPFVNGVLYTHLFYSWCALRLMIIVVPKVSLLEAERVPCAQISVIDYYRLLSLITMYDSQSLTFP